MTKFSRGVQESCVRHNVRSLVLPPMRSTPSEPSVRSSRSSVRLSAVKKSFAATTADS
jgi:hypothetical protein